MCIIVKTFSYHSVCVCVCALHPRAHSQATFNYNLWKQPFIVLGTGLLFIKSTTRLHWHLLLLCQDKSTEICCPQDLLEGALWWG